MELARAALQDNPDGGTPALRELAAVRTEDAESGCHKVFRKYNLTVHVEWHYLNAGTGEMAKCPMILFSNWVQYLLDNDKLHAVTGLEDGERNVFLREFWIRYRRLNPEHEAFRLAARGDLRLEETIPVYSHIDEGRTYRGKPLLVLSVHGALGFGTRSFNKRMQGMGVRRMHIKRNPMKLNFVGSTWGSQFLIFSMTNDASVANPFALDLAMSTFAGDMNSLARLGISSTNGRKKVWILHIGVKGDLPALAKVGQLRRSYARMPRFANTRGKCAGICWLCLAGKEAESEAGCVPFEQFGPTAKWKRTVLQEQPWADIPVIMRDLPWVQGEEPKFLKTDLWHNWHNGVGKIWVACAFVYLAALDVVAGPSMDNKFEVTSEAYRTWARQERISPYLKQLSRETFGYESKNSSPTGSWNKAAVTTHLMLFLSAFCAEHVVGKRTEPILLAIVPLTPWQSFHTYACMYVCMYVCVFTALAFPLLPFSPLALILPRPKAPTS